MDQTGNDVIPRPRAVSAEEIEYIRALRKFITSLSDEQFISLNEAIVLADRIHRARSGLYFDFPEGSEGCIARKVLEAHALKRVAGNMDLMRKILALGRGEA